MFPDQNNGGQPQFQQPAQQPAQQPQQQEPSFSLDNVILDNPAAQGGDQQQQQQPQGQPQGEPQGQPQYQQPAQQPQGQPQQYQQPAQGQQFQPTGDQQQQQPQGQPQSQQNQDDQPIQYTDPYATNGGVRAVRENFERYLDEKFPIKGKLDINSIDKKDPEAFAKFMNDMQEASRNDIANTQARADAKAAFEREIFEPVYQVFPKLKQDPTTDGLVRMLYRGAAADNPNISPVQVVAAFSNFTKQLYNSAVRAAQANVQSIPVAPAGQQGRAATKILNNEVVEKYAGGSVDDVAQLVAAMQGKGVGGL